MKNFIYIIVLGFLFGCSSHQASTDTEIHPEVMEQPSTPIDASGEKNVGDSGGEEDSVIGGKPPGKGPLELDKPKIEYLGEVGGGSSSEAQPYVTSLGTVLQPMPLGYTGGMPVGGTDPADLETFSVAVEDMGVTEFIHLVLGSYLKVNYIVDPKIEKKKDKVTIHMQEPIDGASFKLLVKELLAKYDIAMREKGQVVFVEPIGKRKGEADDYTIMVGRTIPAYLNDDDNVVCFMRTQYIDGKSYVNFIKQVQNVEGQKLYASSDKTLMIKTTVKSLRYIIGIVNAFDKPYLEQHTVSLVRLSYLDPTLLQERLSELLPSLGVPVSPNPQEPGLKMVALAEISGLLLISPDERWVSTARDWIDRLDIPAVLGPEARIFIYRPQNRKAETLAAVLNSLKQESRSDSGTERNVKVTSNQSLASNSPKNNANNSQSKPGEKTGNNSQDVQVVSTNIVNAAENQLVITVDTERNALVIYTTPTIYKEIENTLKKLDTLARQVLVEVIIADVTLTDSLQYGVEWYLNSTNGDDYSSLSTLDGLSLGGSGVLATISEGSGNFLTMLNAFAEDDLVTIISRPRLVVLDNESATFYVGTDVPVVTSEASASDISSDDGSSVLRNIEYRQTGVSMSVTPTIYSNGILRMDITQTVSEAQTNDVSPETDSPLILDRTLQTSVTLKSGQAIMIGGLISESKSSGDQRIPILGDIPWIGNLFKTSSESRTRTEMMIQVRPIILENAEDAVNETKIFEKTLDHLQNLSL